MRLSTRSRIAIAATVLTTGALLGPSAPAGATYPICTPDNCDTLFVYYSDATYSVRVGEYEDGPCGYVDWGQQTSYVKRYQRTC